MSTVASTAVPKPFSTAARIHPPISFDSSAAQTAQKMSRSPAARKWALPAVALISLGTAAVAINKVQAQQGKAHDQIAAADDLRRRNLALMEAYGNKDSLEDLEKALNNYKVQ